MKKLLTLLLIGFMSIQSGFAQTADEIVNHYLENIGGVEKLSQLEGLYMKAKAQAQGMDIPVEIYTFKDGKQKISALLQGQEFVQLAFDGKNAWHTNFMNMSPEKMDAEGTENIKRSSKDNFPNPFLNYKKKGYKIELIGSEEIEGTDTFKIKLTQKPVLVDGKEVPNEVYYYFDKENFVPVAVESEIKSGQAKGAVVQQIFSDYQEVDGLYFPFSTTNKSNGQTGQSVVIEKISLNPKEDDKMFVMPEVSKKPTTDTDKKPESKTEKK